jgi:hypothetical protein
VQDRLTVFVPSTYLHVYERVLHRHHSDDQNIHRQREADDVQVEPDQTLVFLQPRFDKITANDADEEEVEQSIYDKVNYLLAAIPYVVDLYVCLVDLESCRDLLMSQIRSLVKHYSSPYPDAIHRYVDHRDKDGDTVLEVSRLLSIQHEHTHTIDDDLEQKLNL